MNLDILIRIRDQLTGLTRAKQGLSDLNTQVAGSSKQWSQMAAGALGVTAAVGLLGAEIRHVVANIGEIPGVSPETITSIQMMKDNFSQARATLDGWIAKGAEWFSQIGQGLGYLAGAAVYGWDAASDAYGQAEKDAEAAIEAAKKAKDASKTLEEQHKNEAESARRLASAVEALAKMREASAVLGESPGKRINRLNSEAGDLRRKADAIVVPNKGPKDKQDAAAAERAELLATAIGKETEARQLNIQLHEQLVELGDKQKANALERLSLEEQLAQAVERTAEIEAQTKGRDINDPEQAERSLKLETERTDLIERIAKLKGDIATRDKESAVAALGNQRSQIQAKLLENSIARGKLDADPTRTNAEKWPERKKLIEEAVAAQEQYIANLQKIADDTSAPAAVRLDASKEVASGNRDLAGMQGDVTGLGPDPTSMVANLSSSLVALKEQWGTVAQNIAEGLSGTINTALQGTSDLLYNVISGAQSFSDAWNNATLAVGQQFLRMITDMVAKMIWRNTVERALVALGVVTHVQGEATKTAATTAGAGMRILTTIKEAMASVYHGAVEAFKAMAGIPYVGPFLAAAAMAAAIAGGVALVSKIGHADGGYIAGAGTGTSDSIPAMLSNGEYVIPADVVQQHGRGYFDALLAGVIPAGRTDRAAGMQAYMAPAAMAGAGESGSSAGGVPSVAFASFNNQQHAQQWLETQPGERYMVNFLRRRGFKHD